MRQLTFILTAAFFILLISCKQNPTPAAPETETPAQATTGQKMITARVFITAGHEAEFAEAAKWIIENTLKEEGCLQYTLYQDPYDPTNFFFFERYRDQAAIDAHFAASYFTEFGNKISSITSKPAEIKIWDISENQTE